MKKIVSFLFLGIILFACSSNEEKKEGAIDPNANLIETVNGIYTEYYPGKKQVKITGTMDENDERHGRWELYNEDGKQRGFNIYKHGKRHGHSYSSYPNGSPLYHGEYWEDTLIGVWKSYGENGKVVTKDYGLPADY